MSSNAGRWRAVGRLLAAGGVYDLVFAVSILVFTRPSAALLGLSVPDDPVYLLFNGIFLVLLGALYLVAAREPQRYSAVAPVSAGGRGLGFLFLTWAWLGGRPVTFLALGVADLAIGLATFVVWRRAIALSD